MTGGGSKELVAKSLIDYAKAEGSDNMTAIVVFFDIFELKEPPAMKLKRMTILHN